jgi:zinc protease
MYLTLNCGARLLVDRIPGAPVAAIYLWLDVGSADEGPGEHGAAHFVEHMLFKGTESRGVGEAVDAVEALGGDVNAWTSTEETVYHATAPADAWGETLETLVDMVLHSRFDPEEVENERGVILEEIRGGRDDPGRLLAEAVQARAWKGHPYGRPVIGTYRSVGGMPRETLVGFWRRWYSPANLVIAVSGDVEEEAVRARVEALIPAPGAAPLRPGRPPVDHPARRRVTVVEADFEEPMLELAFPAVPAGHPDEPALEVLAEILAGGSSSRLHRALKVEARAATSAWASLQSERDGGLLLVGFAARRGAVTEALEALARCLAVVADQGVSSAELRRARAGLRAGRLFELETVDGRASELAHSAVFFGDPAAGERYAAALAGCSLEAVQAAARRYLDLRRCTAAALVRPGGLGAAAIKQILDAPARPRGRPPGPRIYRRVLESGLTVVVEVDEQRPVSAMRLAGLGGQLTERAGTAGRASAWARAVVGGAGELSYEALSDATAELGGSLGGFSGMNTMGLRGDFPSDALLEGMSLLAAAACRPRFEAAHVERVLAEQAEALAFQQDDPAGLAWEKLGRMVFGRHPYGLPTLGTTASIKRLRRGALTGLHRAVFGAENLVLAVVGPNSPEEVLQAAAELLAPLPRRGALLRPRPAPPAAPSRRRAILRSAREQAHVVMGWPGARLLDPDQPALELAGEVLGRQGGRLFTRVREELGLAYEVSAYDGPAWDAGLFGVYVGCEPERADEAAAAMLAVVEELAARGPDPEELGAVKRLAAGLMAMDRQRASSRASELALWERYGVPAERYREWQTERLEAVSAEDIRRALAVRLEARFEVRALPE